ncbi:MAG: NYN domain-containing protein [Synechococcaceae cyanobacterium SM2_3_1]|nr:NYN domain-containing protein [Synechococcaceae cyanobacterium SM2_3_1]
MSAAALSPTILLVDGYNVIGAWSHLQELALQAQMDLARLQLVESLASYTAFRNYQTTVVFDAYGQATPVTQECSPSGIQIVYTSYGETADTWIERWCAQGSRPARRVRVATSDRVQQLVVGGYGAEWLSAQQLLEEVTTTARDIRRTRPRQQRPIPRGIHGYLDSSTLNRLAQWRITGQDPRQIP